MTSAWVIGGTSGIGMATAKLLKSQMVTYVDGADTFDVRRSVRDFRWTILNELHLPTHFVYCAGINHLEWLGAEDGSVSPYPHADVVDVNLNGFIRFIDALAYYREEYEEMAIKPSIVAVSSDAAERPLRTSIGYCASKAGLNMAVKVAARELGPHGWRVNAVAPGMTEPTGMQEYVDRTIPAVRGWTTDHAMYYERSQEVTPGRITVDAVASTIVQTLMGPAHLNGSVITINGGR